MEQDQMELANNQSDSCSMFLPNDNAKWVQNLIYTVFIPIVCVPGIFAAIVCVIVFTRPKMLSSLNVYLAGLSLFDLLLLVMSLLIYPPMSICVQTHSNFVCHMFWRTALVTFPVSLVCQTASVWTCVGITVDRYLAIKYPLKARVLCTPFKAAVFLLIIATISLLYKMPSVFELRLDDCGRIVPTELRKNFLYIIIYNTYGYILFLIFIPWTIMIILNTVVVKAVHSAHRKRCTVMALVMLSTFIIFNLLAGANNILEAFGVFEGRNDFRISLGNLLVCINSASNIVIYSIFGRRFRHTCVEIFFPCVDKNDYMWLAQTVGINQSEFDCRKASYPLCRRRASSMESERNRNQQRRKTETPSCLALQN